MIEGERKEEMNLGESVEEKKSCQDRPFKKNINKIRKSELVNMINYTCIWHVYTYTIVYMLIIHIHNVYIHKYIQYISVLKDSILKFHQCPGWPSLTNSMNQPSMT